METTPFPAHLDTVRAIFRRNLEARGLPTRYADNMQEPAPERPSRRKDDSMARLRATLLELDPTRLAVAECLVNAFLEADGIPVSA